MQYAPTRARAKFGRFHIFPSGYAKNAPDFTHPNKDTPKTCPILGANPCRKTFGGVCNTPLHGYMKNLADFIFPHTDTCKTRSILDLNLRRGVFRGVCNTPLHGYVQNLAGFIFPHPDAPKNAPDFTLPNRDTPKTHPVLGANLRRRTFRGVCFCAPTRVRAKFGGFHISAHGYTQNAPHFTHPNKDTPKTHPISSFPIRIHPNPTRF